MVRKSKTEGKDRYTRLHFPDAPTKVTWSQLQDKIAKELKVGSGLVDVPPERSPNILFPCESGCSNLGFCASLDL